MKSVVLSTTEAEYMALSGERIEIHCATIANHEHYSRITNHRTCGQCWCNMAIKQQKYRRQNKEHIYIRTAFVKEYQEDGKIIIKFVKSEDNEADIFTKNTSSIIFQRHQEKLVWDKKEVIEDK